MTDDDDFRDDFGATVADALGTRSSARLPPDIGPAVHHAGRSRTRRRVIATALTISVAATAIGLLAARGNNSPRVSVTPTPSSTSTPETTSPTTPTTTKQFTTPTVAGDGGDVQQFTPASASTWWAVVADNLKPKTWVVRTVDRGRHWRNVSPASGYNASFFLNADTAWVEAGTVTAGSRQTVFRTLDGGASWQPMGKVPGGCELQFVDEVHGWCTIIGAASGSGAVDLWRTSDGGATWTLVSRTGGVSGNGAGTPSAIPFGCDKSVTFTSPTVGWAPFYCDAGGGRGALLYQSTDGGTTWHKLPTVPIPPLPTGVSADSGSGLDTPVVDGSYVAVTVTISGRPGATAISTSADGGATWRTQLVPEPTKQWSVDLIDPTHWRIANGTTFMETDDAGRHWRSLPPPATMHDAYGGLLELNFLSVDLGFTVPDPDGGPYWWTTNGGASWKSFTINAGPYQLPGDATG